MEIYLNHPLLLLNTFGIEVFAREFAALKNDEDVRQFTSDHQKSNKQVIILGGGSNILFTGGFSGMVIRISTMGKELIKEDEDEVVLRVAAGEDWDGLVEYCVERGWGGLENLSGIPGQVGSSPIQNIGAYGTELKDHFKSLEGINLCTGESFSYDSEHCRFGYRDSIFKRALKGRVLITHVIFLLKKKPVFNLTYQALKLKLENTPTEEITLHNIRETILAIRASKLPDPKVIGNAGSFFKNPVVSKSQLESLKADFPGIVSFEAPTDDHRPPTDDRRPTTADRRPPTADRQPPTADFKLAAGWLIEQCGWKGFREGDAGVHKDQALVLVNYGNATGREILDLAGKIQRSVKEKFGIDLEREVNVV